MTARLELMNRTDQIGLRKKAAYISLFVGIGMLIVKVGAYLITGSVAIFSDAAESVVHIAATSMEYVSIYYILRAPAR